MARLGSIWRKIGPGLITGASDDDPSGIAIYAQTGAQSGFTLLWAALFTFPLMSVIQEVCARIGLVTGHGLAGNLKQHYPRYVMLVLMTLVVAGNTLNIGADISAMAATANLLVPIPQPILAIGFSVIIILLMIYSSYRAIAGVLKWVALTLLVYLLVPFLTTTDWREAIYSTVVPRLALNRENLLLFIAILGTTISPYLFFWQTSMEVEDRLTKVKRFFARWIVTKHELKDMKADVTLGMFLSNIVMWFIIVATAVTLHSQGVTNIATTRDAADALRPIAGDAAYLIFGLGVISIGFLAIPVLAGSSSYALAETMGWREGLNKKFHQAKEFYLVIIISTLVGLLIPLLGVDPIKALFYTGIFYGVTAPPLIFVIMHIANNKKVMGRYVNSPITNFIGYLTLILMSVAVIVAVFV